MAVSETAKLLASLELKDKFSPTLKNANSALGRFDSKLTNSQGRAYKAGQQIGTGIRNVGKLAVAGFGVLAANVALGVDSLIKVENATAQTNAVLKSTGGAAGQSAADVRKLAESYEALNAQVGDEVIQSGENLLLTFTNIRSKAFEPTLAAALDMNQALGKGPEGLTNTVRVLGKALNDPTKGMGALSRVGITFSKEQTKRIKALQKEGKLYDAQKIILDELTKRFGGSFAAAGDTAAGSIAKFTDAIEDTQRTLATAALPAVRNIADALTELVADPEIQKGARDLGVEIGKALSKDNIKNAARVLGDAFRTVKDLLPGIRDAVGTIADVVGKAVDAFSKLPPEVQKLAIGGLVVNKLTGGLLTNIAGAIASSIIKTPFMNVTAANVTVAGGVGGAGGLPGAAGAGGGLLGAGATVGSLILPATIIAAISGIGTQIANDLADKVGFKTDVTNPFAGGIFGNLEALPSMLGIMGELLNVAQHPPAVTIKNTGTAGHEGKGKDDLVPATKKGTQQAIKDAARNARLVAQVQKSVDRDRAETSGRLDRVKATAASVRDRVESAKIATVSATNAGASNIVAAIHGIPAPIVNVNVTATTVTKSVTTQKRSGGGGTSRNKDRATPQ